MSASEAPSFNGLSEEAFSSGTQMLGAWEGLTPQQQKEVLPHLLDRMKASLLRADELSADDLRSAGRDLRTTASALDSHAIRIEERVKPFEPLPEDDYQN